MIKHNRIKDLFTSLTRCSEGLNLLLIKVGARTTHLPGFDSTSTSLVMISGQHDLSIKKGDGLQTESISREI
jgi:hypothetical protein